MTVISSLPWHLWLDFVLFKNWISTYMASTLLERKQSVSLRRLVYGRYNFRSGLTTYTHTLHKSIIPYMKKCRRNILPFFFYLLFNFLIKYNIFSKIFSKRGWQYLFTYFIWACWKVFFKIFVGSQPLIAVLRIYDGFKMWYISLKLNYMRF